MIPLPLLLFTLSGSEAFKPSGPYSPPLNKPYDQRFADQYSPLKYMGNLGPYCSRRGNGISPEVPEGCEVDQVLMLQRHGERYPSVSDGYSEIAEHQQILSKIKQAHPQPFEGELEFLNTWTYFIENEGVAGLETDHGPYAGLTDLFEKGAEFRGRYGHLWDGQSKVPLFASGSERVLQSARSFGQGFFSYNYTDIAELNIIPESESAGGNAISPLFCDVDTKTECKVPQPNNTGGVYEIVFPEFDIAAIRLNEKYGLSLTGLEVGTLFELGAYDLSIRGTSPWLDVFTREEWLAYAYRRGLWFYCYFGEGSQSARAIGANWADALTKILNQGPEGSGLPIALSFSHESDITSLFGGIGILSPLKEMSTDTVTFDTRWDIDDIVPMGAQVVIERLKCKAPGLTNNTNVISSNQTVPDSLLNSTYGHYNASSYSNLTTGYFSSNYTNSTSVVSFTVPMNSTNMSYTNQTTIGPYSNITTTVVNGTSGLVVNEITSTYGFNATNGTTNGEEEEESIFVRVVLNDAVVPLDFCYDGPGYSCSLDNWTNHVNQKVEENNYEKVCKPKQAGVPSSIDFYWNYNKTTSADIPSYVPWQGSFAI